MQLEATSVLLVMAAGILLGLLVTVRVTRGYAAAPCDRTPAMAVASGDPRYRETARLLEAAAERALPLQAQAVQRLREHDPALAEALGDLFEGEVPEIARWLSQKARCFGARAPIEVLLAGERERVIDSVRLMARGDFAAL